MKVFIVNKVDDHFIITSEEMMSGSPRLKWLKKTFWYSWMKTLQMNM